MKILAWFLFGIVFGSSPNPQQSIDAVYQCSSYSLNQIDVICRQIFAAELDENTRFNQVRSVLLSSQVSTSALLDSSDELRKYVGNMSCRQLCSFETKQCSAREWALRSGNQVDLASLLNDRRSALTYFRWAVHTLAPNAQNIERCIELIRNYCPEVLDDDGFCDEGILTEALLHGYFYNSALIANMFNLQPSKKYINALVKHCGIEYALRAGEFLKISYQQYVLLREIRSGHLDNLSRLILNNGFHEYRRLDGTTVLIRLIQTAICAGSNRPRQNELLYQGCLAMIDDILKEPGTLEETSKKFCRCLPSIHAAKSDCVELVAVLVNNGVPMNAVNCECYGTALHTALLHKQFHVVNFLFSCSTSSLDIVTPVLLRFSGEEEHRRYNPLQIAAHYHDVTSTWELLRRGAEPETTQIGIDNQIGHMHRIWSHFRRYLVCKYLPVLDGGLHNVYMSHILPYLHDPEFLL